MNVIVAAEAPWAGAAAVPEHRPRLSAGENTIVHTGVVVAERSTATPEKRRERPRGQVRTDNDVDSSMAFAAAVIASTLPPPVPTETVEDLVQLIGGGAAEEEAETQLRDRFA